MAETGSWIIALLAKHGDHSILAAGLFLLKFNVQVSLP